MLIPVSAQTWPPELWDTELWVKKCWPEWHAARLVPNPLADPSNPNHDPYWLDYPWMWPLQTIFVKVINNGTAGVYIGVRILLEDTVTGWIQAVNSNTAYIGPGPCSTVVLETKLGPVDLYYGLFIPWEDFQQYPATWLFTCRLRISIDGLNWYYWDTVQPPLPGYGYCRGEDKFKLLPP